MGIPSVSQRKSHRILTTAGLGLILAAYTLVRLSLVSHMTPSLSMLPTDVYISGLTQDAGMLLLACGFGWLLRSVTGLPWLVGSLLLAFIGMVSSMIHGAYFGFFHTRLDAWVVQQHFHDFGMVAGSGARVGFNWQTTVGVVLFFAGAGALIAAFRRRPRGPGNFFVRHAQAFAFGALVVTAALLTKQVPVWKRWVHRDPARGGFKANIAGEHIFFIWYDQVYGNPDNYAGDRALPKDVPNPHATIAEFAARDLAQGEKLTTPELRAKLGLPKTGPIHLFLVFLESGRGYELKHPWLSKMVLPNLSQVIGEKGLYFEQAYSSSLEPGQTARGLHSTLCGRLPNIGGPAVFIAYNHLKTGCLPEVLGLGGYETISIQPYKKHYHNAMFFESLHGTQKFFDMYDVIQREPGTKQITWGADERSYFRQAFEIASEEIAATPGRPLFAHLRTNTTHPPFVTDTGVPLPQEIESKLKKGEYRDYLTAYHYTDLAVSEFVRKVMAAPFGDRSLVVVMGDHSLLRETDSVFPLTDYQKREIQARIPLALLTRNMPAPQRIARPVHQMDVAPTLARVAGLKPHGDWLGGGLFGKRSTAWIFGSESGVSYRTTDRLCLAGLRNGERTTCFRMGAEEDPLFTSSAAVIPEDPKTARFFDHVLRADRYLIHNNRIQERVTPRLSGT